MFTVAQKAYKHHTKSTHLTFTLRSTLNFHFKEHT